MKIVLAFDSFKGCLTAEEACRTAASAISSGMPDAEVVEMPLSDGGEGLVESMKAAFARKGERLTTIECKAHGPLMEDVVAHYAISCDGTTAFMEMAETSGLTLVPTNRRNPLRTTTYGVGDMLLDASRRGCKKVVMGIGGSATCDAGKGMIDRLRNSAENLNFENITVACDVTNPLYGENGAAYVFGPQKGADAAQVEELDKRLRLFAKETEALGKATPEQANRPGTGAAGGLGYGLMAYLNAELKSGIDIILDINCFDRVISNANLVITGEGKSDAQTLMGKVPHGVLNRCKVKNIPVWLLSGGIEEEAILKEHFSIVRSINEGDSRPIEVLMQKEVAKENIKRSLTPLPPPAPFPQPLSPPNLLRGKGSEMQIINE